MSKLPTQAWNKTKISPHIPLKTAPSKRENHSTNDAFWLVESRDAHRLVTSLIDIFHMTSRRPYWCPQTITRRPFWCFKQVLWTDLKPPVLRASAQGDKIEPIFRPLYKSLPNLQTQCQSISDWTPNSAILDKVAENFNLREETSRSLQFACN